MSTHRPRKGVELYSEDEQYLVLVDVPGRTPAEVTCRLEDGSLSVSAAPPTDDLADDPEADPVDRTIGFPRSIRSDDVEATLADGVLRVELPTGEGSTGDRAIHVAD